MDVKKFVLSYYDNASGGFHITQITEPKEALNLHSHGYYQIYYVLSGKLVHHVEDFTAELSGGDVFILPPDIPHYIEKKDKSVDFYSLSFMPDYFSGVRESNKLIADFLYYLKTVSQKAILPKFNLPHDDMLFVDTILKRIMYEFKGDKKGKEEVIKECTATLLSIFARIYFEQETDSLHTEMNRDSVLHCIEYIKNHFDESVSLNEIAKRSAMSKTCFCDIFKSITGMSFNKFLNTCRIQKAVQMIQSGEKITTAGTLCGYEYFSTFYRNFKDIMGISPSEYQRINRT